MNKRIEVSGRMAFYLFLTVITIIIITVWITGFDVKRTVLTNAEFSLSIITLLFFLFVTFGLYKGLSIRNNFGRIKDKITFAEPTGIIDELPMDIVSGDGVEELVLGILAWIGIAILIILFMFFFETIILAGIVLISTALYWIFYRATRMILWQSRYCKGNFKRSMLTGLKYSLLYSSWLFAILFTIEIIKK